MVKRNPLSDNEKRLNELAREYEAQRSEGKYVYMEPDDLADLCLWYDNNHDPDKADEVMDYALRTYPDVTMLQIEQAYRYLDKGDLDAAIILANQIENDKTGDLQLLKIRLLIESEEYEKAEELLNSYPPDDFDPIMVANMFMEAHFSEKAIDWLKKHGQGFEGEEDYMSILMNAYFYSGRYQEAIEMCEKLIDKDPFSAHYWISLARCQLALGEYDKALDACDFSITNDEDMGEAYLTRCNLFALLSNDRKAKENLKHAIELHAVVPGDMNEMDLALLLDQDRVEDAIKLMNFYLKYLDLTEEQIVNTYFRLGVCYAHMRWDKQAFEYFDKVLEHRPNDAEVLTQKSMLYVNQENFDAALNQLKAAIENEPERKYLYRTMGIISLIMKNYDDFRRYSSISDEPLTEDELNEAIKMAETNDEFSINYLLEGVRRNLGI
ncbi:MAG: tetratricopeptide repeat protein [Bacteroidaceae bacterium]|nr:tetratricopeptide repeat protein [Bacteroidaceae bacterium]